MSDEDQFPELFRCKSCGGLFASYQLRDGRCPYKDWGEVVPAPEDRGKPHNITPDDFAYWMKVIP